MGEMVRDRQPLILGIALLLLGSYWLIFGFSWLPRFGGALFGGGVLALIALGSAAIYQGNPGRRWPLFVLAGLLAGVATVVVGGSLRLMPDALEPLLILGGAAAALFLHHRQHGRRPGFLIAALSTALIAVTAFIGSLPHPLDHFAGPFLLFGAALPFVYVFLGTGREGLLIPAGALMSVAATVAGEEILRLPDQLCAAALLLGLAATFAVVYLVGRPRRSSWARFPAVGLGLLGLVLGVVGPVMSHALPVALIGLGIYLILRSRRPQAG